MRRKLRSRFSRSEVHDKFDVWLDWLTSSVRSRMCYWIEIRIKFDAWPNGRALPVWILGLNITTCKDFKSLCWCQTATYLTWSSSVEKRIKKNKLGRNIITAFFPFFAHGWCNIHELCRQSNGDRSLTHSLTHSNLIKLFNKLELSNFLLPPLLSIVFVQECSVVLRKVWRGETRKAYIFVESLGKSLSSASKIEVGHYGFHVVLFRKYVVFLLSASAHT